MSVARLPAVVRIVNGVFPAVASYSACVSYDESCCLILVMFLYYLLCIVSVRMEKSFPEFAPSVSLHQIYPAEMGNSSGISDCEVILPHSPRWTPEEIAKRLHKECSIAMCQGM